MTSTLPEQTGHSGSSKSDKEFLQVVRRAHGN